MSLTAQATEIAGLVESGCDIERVYPSIPGRVEAFSAIVSPAPEWGNFESGTFCEPDVNWEIILVAGTSDYTATVDWFFARIVELAAVADLGVLTWSQPQTISHGGSEFLAVRVQLAPRSLEV